MGCVLFFFFFFQAEDGIRDVAVTGVQTCALPIFMVVEDDASLAELLAYGLQARGDRFRAYRNGRDALRDRKSTRLNSSHGYISYAVFCLKKKNRRTVPGRSPGGPERPAAQLSPTP